MSVRIALVQTEPATSDMSANLAVFDGAMERAAGMGAQLVVFPELALSGYARGDAFFEVTESVPGPSMQHLAATARKLGLHVIWGLSGVLYNSAVLGGCLRAFADAKRGGHPDRDVRPVSSLSVPTSR